MKISLEIKALFLGLLASLFALGLSFGAGVFLRAMAHQIQTNARDPAVPATKGFVSATPQGRSLFLKNCAHCHADDATGDEGPDLHGLKKSDDWIARRIRNGVKGEMTAFGEKFSQADIDALIAYLRTLK